MELNSLMIRGYKLSDELEDEIQDVIESNFEGVPSPIGRSYWKIIY